MMRAGQHPGAVDHIIHTGWNTGGDTVTLFDCNHSFDQALALGQKLDELFVNNIDLTAQVRDICFGHRLAMNQHLPKVNVSKRRAMPPRQI